MREFALSVLKYNGAIFKGKAEMVVVPGIEGELGILAGHIPFIAILKKGTVKIKRKEGERRIEIERGFIKVGKEKVEVLVE
ncbi:MAG: ATP synthase F1 subunit epsilon [Candidatus Omnitrophota bacterium]|nr:MAG: ATP synthase F1 subunit epsilon [Candidatus Omnitrophota bacterium]